MSERYICPRCKYPVSVHDVMNVTYSIFDEGKTVCRRSQREVYQMIIDMQLDTIAVHQQDHDRIELLEFYLKQREYIDLGYNRPMQMLNENGTEELVGQNEFYLNGDNIAPTLRQAIDKYFEYERHREDEREQLDKWDTNEG